MEWAKIKRLRPAVDQPEVIIKNNRLTFNAVLDRAAELAKYSFVCIYSDDERRRLGFKFLLDNDDSDAFKLSRSGNRGCWCYSRDLFSKDWVRKVASNTDINRFACVKQGELWVITLIPCFELYVMRNEANIIEPSIAGVYRYINSDGDIVYIGKGFVKARLMEKKRDNWIFEKIEYSIIKEDKDALSWERFYIDKYRNDNNGDLPPYNKINGHG